MYRDRTNLLRIGEGRGRGNGSSTKKKRPPLTAAAAAATATPYYLVQRQQTTATALTTPAALRTWVGLIVSISLRVHDRGRRNTHPTQRRHQDTQDETRQHAYADVVRTCQRYTYTRRPRLRPQEWRTARCHISHETVVAQHTEGAEFLQTIKPRLTTGVFLVQMVRLCIDRYSANTRTAKHP